MMSDLGKEYSNLTMGSVSHILAENNRIIDQQREDIRLAGVVMEKDREMIAGGDRRIAELEATLAEAAVALTAGRDFLKGEKDKDQQIQAAIRTIQIHQPGGSPPPGDWVVLLGWVLRWHAEQIAKLQPFSDALRKRHNGYDPDVRAETGVPEPPTPAQALEELIEEATRLGKYEAEAQIAALQAALADRDRQIAFKDTSIKHLKQKVARLADSLHQRDESLHERKQQIRYLQPYCYALRNLHNGYSREVRKEIPTVKEPETPEQAISELIEEATDLGRLEAKAYKDLQIAALQAEFIAMGNEEHDGERCQRCGRAYDTVWNAMGNTWETVIGSGAGLYCPMCFDLMCREKGIWLHWHAYVDDMEEVYTKMDALEAERERLRDIEIEVNNLVGAFAAVGICEPAEGFVKSPRHLRICMNELRAKHKALTAELAQWKEWQATAAIAKERDRWKNMATKLYNSMPNPQNIAADPAWWCCNADYPNHEPTCRNYKAPQPPAEDSRDTVESVCSDWRAGAIDDDTLLLRLELIREGITGAIVVEQCQPAAATAEDVVTVGERRARNHGHTDTQSR